MRLGALNPEEPFSGITVPLEIKENKQRMNEVIENSRKYFAKKFIFKPNNKSKKIIQESKTDDRGVNKRVSILP